MSYWVSLLPLNGQKIRLQPDKFMKATPNNTLVDVGTRKGGGIIKKVSLVE